MTKTPLIAALVLGGLLACASVVVAQDSSDSKDAPGKKKRPGIEQQMERLSTELKLTDEQKPKVKAVLEAGTKQRQEMRDVPQDQRREKMQAFMEEQNKKMKAILTPEQMEKYQKMREEMRRNRPGGPGGADGEKKKAE